MRWLNYLVIEDAEQLEKCSELRLGSLFIDGSHVIEEPNEFPCYLVLADTIVGFSWFPCSKDEVVEAWTAKINEFNLMLDSLKALD